MSITVYSVREANRLLPRVGEAVRRIQQTAHEVVRAQDRASVLTLIGGRDPGSPEHAELLQRRRDLEESVTAYQIRLGELQKLGCILKDLNLGVVDFYGRKKNRLVFLCWKLGEKRISYWHDLDAGFAGRRPIRELRGAQEEREEEEEEGP